MSSVEARKRYREKHPERDKANRLAAKLRWIARNPEKHAESNRARAGRYYTMFPEKVKAARKVAYANADVKRSYRCRNLQLKFGITLVEWEAKFEAQGRVCECCGADTPGSRKGWQTDHCHFTGNLRGIICFHCNHVLTEHFQMKREQVLAYLERHEGV